MVLGFTMGSKNQTMWYIGYFIISNHDVTICPIRAATTERNEICQINATISGVTTAIKEDGIHCERAMNWEH